MLLFYIFQVQISQSFVEHSHPRDNHAVEALKLRCLMKTQAKTNRGRPGQILASGLESASDEVRARIGKTATIKRDIRRKQRGNLPKEPATLRELIIGDEWTTTGGPDPKPFLIHDSGPDAVNRVVMFATEASLRVLSRAQWWFMDGNFSMAPKIFSQLYIIRAPLGTSAITCVYAFLSNKSQSLYEEMLQALLDTCERHDLYPDPEYIVTDFERAVVQAITVVLGPDVQKHGCFYHLTQATWRKIQELGLSNLYKENEDVRTFCGMLDGLAFLPLDKIVDGMLFIRENTPPELEALVDYFDSTYVSGSFRRVQPVNPNAHHDDPPRVRFRRLPPMFPPSLWNVHDITMNDQARTNNLSEAWNIGFQQLVGHQHPSIWTAIDYLRKDQAMVQTLIVQDARGEPPAKRVKRATKDFQTRVKNLCIDFVEGRKTLEEFMRGVGHCVRIK